MVVSEVRGPRRAPLRLTRRGRAVVLALAVLLGCVSSAVLFATASHAAPPATGAPVTGASPVVGAPPWTAGVPPRAAVPPVSGRGPG